MIVFVIFGGIMRKQYKVNVKHILNKRLSSYIDNGAEYWAVYVQLSFHRKTTQIKSGLFMTESEFNNYQQGKTAKGWRGGYNPDKDGLKPHIEPVETRLKNEIETLKNIILLLDNWLNSDYDITAPRFDSDRVFFTQPASFVIERLGRIIDCDRYESEPTPIGAAKQDFFNLLAYSHFSYEELCIMFDTLEMPFSNIITKDNLKHWLFKINSRKTLIDWLTTDYEERYKNNQIATAIVEELKALTIDSHFIDIWRDYTGI